ncbi:ABC transporter substrate-binding protein [Paenibacillus sp. J31TS4]|uniref:ABC transporter substrate-binding protein n=1 Tax=Paenibacillus sp. J31TS4 TaxID=2807195 RepID=UPI001B17CC72|nr:ABC transporter substrate-binding protein [Paenibacillus sp. J31TS4]GIP41398.1 ABC transporter substrate-binding protein [Paenibacillus sp. J31TS4]
MYRKKAASLFAVLALTAVSTLGCSSGGGAEEAGAVAPSASEDQTPVTIQYWHAHADVQLEGLNYMLAEFKKKYPWITVEPVYQGAYADLHKKLLAAVAAKEVPAVTNVEVASIPNFGEGGIFMDLNPYIKRDKMDVNDFSQGMLKAYAYNNKQYGLPLIVSANVFIYNKTMFDKEGIKPPQTWEEIEPFAQKLTKKEGSNVSRYAFSVPGWDMWYAETWMRNGGGTPLTDDNKSGVDQPNSVKFMKKFREWMDKGYLQMGYGKGASDTMRQMFFDEKVGMVMHTSALIKWYMENAKFEIGVLFPPGDQKRISHIGGAGIAVMDMVPQNQKEAAWKFVEFMTAPDNNIKWADYTGYLPTRKSAITSAEGTEYFSKKPQYKAVFENFDNVIGRPQHPNYPAAIEVLKNAIGNILLDNKDVETEFKAAAKGMNEVLEDN